MKATELFSYKLDNIPASIDEVEIRKRLARDGIHVASVEIQRGGINPSDKGNGELKVKLSSKYEKNSFKEKIGKLGLSVKQNKRKEVPKYEYNS